MASNVRLRIDFHLSLNPVGQSRLRVDILLFVGQSRLRVDFHLSG